MARRMRNPRRRNIRKPTVAAAKKVVRKSNTNAKKKNMDTFALTVRSMAQIVPVQGVTVANYFYTTVPLMDPTLATGVTQNSEFNLYKNMYDQVRINSVSVTLTPKANVLDMTRAQADGNYTLSGDGLCHTVLDRDSPSGMGISVMSRYPSYLKISLLKKFTRRYGIKYPVGIWLDTSNIYANDDLLKSLGAYGGVYCYGENVLEDKTEIFNEILYDIHISYNVVFRGKTQGSLTYNEANGSITVLSIDSLPPVAPSPFVNVRGSITDKLVTQTPPEEGNDDELVESNINDQFRPDDAGD